ncbi:MAG: ABC transporter permease [Anaerolineales bacterium]|nr:ABC transporter permease [Anaerolineales bacterium]
MNFLKRYLIPRLVQYILVIFLGITAVFIIPRLLPNDPVAAMIGVMQARGAQMEPGAMEVAINALKEMYGLEGSWWEQYVAFWSRLFRGDFGVSFFQFPTTVNQMVARAMPWTLGLLLISTAINWTLGNIVGGLAGYYSRRRWSRLLDAIAMVIRPQPYYIFAFMLLLVFGYFIPWFPVAGGTDLGRKLVFNWVTIQDILHHSFLPAMSMIVLGAAINFQTMKLIVQNVNAENFVQYAKLGGVTESRIVGKYVIRNAVMPQITGLALSLGQIFSGALITEIVFSYPGLGTLIYNAIVNGDYNLIMGITVYSILGITTMMLALDLLYPLFDPRVRYT